MRSALVHSARHQITNGFLLSTVAMSAVRKLHVNSTRVEDTTNQVLSEVANGSYVDVKMPEIKAADDIGHFLLPIAS